MSTIQHLLEKQREEFEKLSQENINDLIGGVYGKFPEKDKLLLANNRLTSFLSTIQQEILSAVKEKVEGMNKEYESTDFYDGGDEEYRARRVAIDSTRVTHYNLALSDLSSWLEGEKK